MSVAESTVREASRQVLAYLAETDPLPATPADAVIGFGMFDLRLPRYCGELYARGLVRRIIFTGGIGAGTGDLGGPEAEIWRAELRRSNPEIPAEHVIIEPRSTNTAENVAFTAALLAQDHPEFTFGRGLRTAIIVASPSRLRRVGLTLRLQQPRLSIFRQRPPDATLAGEQALYARNRVGYLSHLAGELDRIVRYPKYGWIATEPLPDEIAAAHAVLRAAESK